MKREEWVELENLTMRGNDVERGKKLLKKTEKEDAHPDWYNGPCQCATCRSYYEE